MEGTDQSEVLLLKETYRVIWEIAQFFVGDDKKAQRARKRLKKKDPDSGAFYVNLSQDLEKLGDVLQGIPDTWSDGQQGSGTRAVRKLLNVVQTRFLIDFGDRSGDEAEDFKLEVKGPFTRLKFFFQELQNPDDGPEDSKRIEWFCEMTLFERPEDDARDLLIDAVQACHAALKGHTQALPVDISWLRDDRTVTEWAEAGEFYSTAEKLHQTLEQCWDCNCFADHSHKNAKFSFDLASPQTQGSVIGTMYYPTVESGTFVWKFARLQYQEHGSSPVSQLEPLTAMSESNHYSSRRTELALRNTRSGPSSRALCDVLEASGGGGLVKLAAGTPKLHNAPEDDLSTLSTTATGQDALVDCLELSQATALSSMKRKHRLTLALVLAYAYLHLGGGSWWPYDKKSSVHLLDAPSSKIALSWLPFFTPSLSQGDQREEAPGILKAFNPDMPSLPAFGKLLLELYIGRPVTWDQLDSQLKWSEDEEFAKELLHAINTCLAMAEDKTFKEGGTIRANERLRGHFVKEVVLPVQYVLQIGYQLKVQDIFGKQEAGQVVEIRQSPARLPKRLRSPLPVPREGPETVPQGFCLHDGQDMEELVGTDANSADKYMTDMNECLKPALYGELCQKHTSENVKPVKIAILDTGAHILRDKIEDIYDDRVVECRTWLRSQKDEGDALDGTSADHDGHGTHGTSVLLEATQDTDIQIFVAQIFHKRSEKIKQDLFTEDRTVWRISRAIRYAVDTWKVDIISMSFGFPQAVPEIAKAIEHARRENVLMFAAASNCGGNNPRSWPARLDEVMCIYATNGHGNKYNKNPTAARNQNNFAVLGSSVNALWPPNSQGSDHWVRKSGTSTASPIAAAIAGIVISALRRSEEGYLDELRLAKAAREREQETYRRKMQGLGRARSMASVFRLMVGDEGERDTYQYVAPWRLFHTSYRSRTYAIETILRSIDV